MQVRHWRAAGCSTDKPCLDVISRWVGGFSCLFLALEVAGMSALKPYLLNIKLKNMHKYAAFPEEKPKTLPLLKTYLNL